MQFGRKLPEQLYRQWGDWPEVIDKSFATFSKLAESTGRMAIMETRGWKVFLAFGFTCQVIFGYKSYFDDA